MLPQLLVPWRKQRPLTVALTRSWRTTRCLEAVLRAPALVRAEALAL